MRAFEEVLRVREQPLQLVIAGREGWLVDDLFADLKRSPAAKNILFTGYLNDEDLCALYSSCAVFVYPSLYEGFGLPPLEAMACGAPVIASRIPSVEEVVGPAARLVSRESVAELTEAIVELLSSGGTREKLSAAGTRCAAEFSWIATASLTRDVYAEAIERFRQ